MITYSSFSKAKVLLSIFLSALLFSGQAFGKILTTGGRGIHQTTSGETSSLSLMLSSNKPTSPGHVDLAPDVKLLQSRIDALVVPYFDSSSFSGDILAIRNGQVLFNKGYGLADRERVVPITPQTKFYIASISKSFTAAAILLLQERGNLRVNDPVSRFINDFPNGERITIHNLLTHTSGIADYVRFANFAELSKRPYTTGEIIALFRNQPLLFNPGERSSYSNSNYVLLAHIIEKVSGLRYAEFLKLNFFKPFGMKNTGQPDASNQSVANLSNGYTTVGLHGFEAARYFDHSISTGAGSLYSTTEDIGKWIEGILAGRVLKKSSVEQMYKTHADGASGYSWSLGKLWNRDAIIENGWDGVGFAGTLIHFPTEKVTVVVLGNLNISSVTGEIANRVSALIMGENPEPLKIDREPVPAGLATRLVGKYKLGDDFFVPGTVIEIVESEGNLYEQQRNPDRLIGLIRISELEFIHRSSWGKVKFELDDKGEVTGMLFYGSFHASRLPQK